MVDLKTQYELLKSEINEAINEVLSSTNFIQGPNVKQFEKEIANYFSVDSKTYFLLPLEQMLYISRFCSKS